MLTRCHDDISEIIATFAVETSKPLNAMCTIMINGLECELPSVPLDKALDYQVAKRVMNFPTTFSYVAWCCPDVTNNLFLHLLLSHFEAVGWTSLGQFVECDLEPSSERIGRSIYLCYHLSNEAESVLRKFLRTYCNTKYYVCRPFYVAEELREAQRKGGNR